MADTMTGWTDNPNTRGTLDIIFSCLSTIILCVWSVQHLNVPCESDRDITIRKLQWVIFNILAPEFLLYLAIEEVNQTYRDMCIFRQRLADHPETMGGWSIEEQGLLEQLLTSCDGIGPRIRAIFSHLGTKHFMTRRRMGRRSRTKKPELQGPQELRDRPDGWLTETEAPPDLSTAVTVNESKLWTVTHAIYLNMGGIHVEAEDPTSPGQKWKGSIYSDVLIPSDEISEQSHSLLNHLSLSQKEILDKSKSDGLTKAIAVLQIAYFALSVITRKSQNISSSQLEILTLAFASMAVITYLVLWNKPKGIEVPTTINISHFAEDVDKATGVLSRLKERDNERGNGLWAVFDRTCEESGLSIGLLFFVPTLFGGLHCLAWNFTFPSSIERYLWRVSSVSSASTSVISMLWAVLNAACEEKPTIRYSSLIDFLLNVGIWTIVLGYCLARLLLIGVSFSSLRSMPAEVYHTTWSKYLPNIQ